MNNPPAIPKPLIIFAVCVILALFMGYLLADNPLAFSTLAYIGVVTSVLAFPLLLKWHHPLLLLSWNLTATVGFLPGQPSLWLVVAFVSLFMSVLQRTMNRGGDLMFVPQLTWPLIALIVVVLVTAKMTGLGLRAAGSAVYGGKAYVYLLGAVAGYFALSFQRIPAERAGWYVGWFCLSGGAPLIGDLMPFLPSSLSFLYYFFPPNLYYFGFSGEASTGRLVGAFPVAFGVYCFLVARHGLRGIFLAGKRWRWLLLLLILPVGLLGGFRSAAIMLFLMFAVQFYMEGLQRTRLLPLLLLAGMMVGLALVPLARHLPYTVQRTLSFLPLNVDPLARQEAEESTAWRLKMWKALWPQVGEHFWLGKGYALSPSDFELLAGSNAAITQTFEENQATAMSGNYHSGPLSVMLTFGIWGVLAFVWFAWAGIRVLLMNYRHGSEALRRINLFLLVAFVVKVIFFVFVFGVLSGDMLLFCGYLGLSVSLNGGVARPPIQASPLASDKKKIPQKPTTPPSKRPQIIPVTTQGNG